MAEATDQSMPISRAEQDEWFVTFYTAATSAQRTILREFMERIIVNGEGTDEVSVARFRKRFGKPSAQLLAALDAVEYRQAVERGRSA